MEEKKKSTSPILIVILSVVGICLVGFLVWYGVNYFKGEEKPVEQQSSQINEQPSNNNLENSSSSNNSSTRSLKITEFISNNKLQMHYFNSLKGTELINNINNFKPVEGLKNKYENDFLVITYCGFDECRNFKFTGVTGQVKKAIMYYEESDDGPVYVLTDNNDLYFTEVILDKNDKVYELSKLSENIVDVKYKETYCGFPVCGCGSGEYYFLDNSGNYFLHYYDFDNSDKLVFKKIDKETMFKYNFEGVSFDKTNIRNGEIYYKDIAIDTVIELSDVDFDYVTIIIGKDKYLYEIKESSIEKVIDKKIKSYNLKPNGCDNNILTIEFE